VVSNADFYAGLSDERKEMLAEVKAELDDFIYDAQTKANEAALDRIKEAKPDIKVIRLDDEQRAAFKEASKGIGASLVDEVGGDTQEVLDALRKEFGTAM
jgi:TRAP-type C4-dicarboxylate transport system substrate-binding protein